MHPLKTILILSSHLRLYLSCVLFPFTQRQGSIVTPLLRILKFSYSNSDKDQPYWRFYVVFLIPSVEIQGYEERQERRLIQM